MAEALRPGAYIPQVRHTPNDSCGGAFYVE
jgi:hypothetical protein